MRNMLMVSAASVALLGATQAMAQSASTNAAATKADNCAVLDLAASVVFNGDADAGDTSTTEPFTFRCNDFDGGNVTITSANTGLTSGAVPGAILTYDAVVTLNAPLADGDFPLTLVSDDGSTPPTQLDGSADLANAVSGDNNANLDLTLVDGAVFAANYDDTLTIDIQAVP